MEVVLGPRMVIIMNLECSFRVDSCLSVVFSRQDASR